MTYLCRHITSIFVIPLHRYNIYYMATHAKSTSIDKNTTHKRSSICLKSAEDNYKKIKEDTSSRNMSFDLDDLISKYNFVIEDTPTSSPSDNKEYLAIKLSNGLRALLISDVKNLINLEDLKNKDEKSKLKANNQLSLSQFIPGLDDNDDSDDDSVNEESGEDINDDNSDEECRDGKRIDDKTKEKLAACALTVGVGSFSDLEEIPGLAHFLEHMIFMGSSKYPKENDFDSFISKRGGSDNAETDCEHTTFYFDCPEIHLDGAMDRFSQFFVTPLMLRDSMTRERKAVESEFQLNYTSDSVRWEQLICSTAPLENPAHKFMWGNLITLKQNVKDDVLYKELHKFWKRHYSAHRMTVAIQARLPIKKLVDLAAKYFGQIKNNQLPPDSFPIINPPFKMELFNKMFIVEPIKEITKLKITWGMPSVKFRYRTKPLIYISHLIGHEGEGSLLGLLQDNLWALAAGAGIQSNGIDYNSLFTMFTIHIMLTDKGRENIESVLNLVFSYIKLLQTNGPSESLFREIQSVGEICFRFKEEESDAAYYVEEMSQLMQDFPSIHYLDGTYLFFEYDPNEIQEFLDLMTIDNANIMIMSKSERDKVGLNMIEKWFNTKYNVVDIPEEWVTKWRDAELHPSLHFPEPNPYIATDFKMFPLPEKSIDAPRIILNTDYIETWHKQDTQFKLPIGVVRINLISPVILTLPQNSVMTDMFAALFQLVVVKDAYPAKVAGLDYSLQVCESGLILTIYGYNDKLELLFDLLINELNSFIEKVNEGLFEAMKEVFQKRYYNKLLKLSTLSNELRLSILCKPYWSSNIKADVLQDITLEKLKLFSSEMLGNVYVKCLIQGNITEKQALDISNKITQVINYKPLSSKCYPELLIRKLPEAEKILRVQSFNTKDVNCNVTNYYQCGISTVEEYCKVDLLVMIIEEPLFDTLRTKEQLGYDISCDTRITNGILGFSVTVKSQADKFEVNHVEQRITEFLKSMHKFINKMPTKEFDQVKESLKIIKQQNDNDLRSAMKRNWSEIVTNEYMFDRLKKELECIDSFDSRDIAEYLSQMIVGHLPKKDQPPTTCRCLKLCIQIDGKQELNDIPENKESTSQVKTNELKLKIPKKDQTKFISDIEGFKDSLNMYPVQCKIKRFK